MGKPVEAAYDQATFRARTAVPDPAGVNTVFDGGDAAANANWVQAVDTIFRIRFVIQQTAAAANQNLATEFALQYNYDGGGWNPVVAQGADTDPVQYVNATGMADGDNTTQILGGGGTFITGDGVEVTPTDTLTFTTEATSETEIEFALEIVSEQVIDAKTLQLQLVYSVDDESPPETVLGNYSNTPTVTVDEAAAPVNIEVPPATLVITSYIPTAVVSDHIDIEVPVSSLVVTSYVPTVVVTEHVDIEIPAASLRITRYVPTVAVTAHIDIEVPVSALAVTTYVPTVVVVSGVDIEVPVANLVLTPYVPTVITTAHVDIEVPASTLVITSYVPTAVVTVHVDVEVPVANLRVTRYIPTVAVTAHIDIEVPIAILGVTSYAPTVITISPIDIEVSTATLQIATHVPTIVVSDHINIEVPAASLGITSFTPVITWTGHVFVVVPVASLVLTTFRPVVIISSYVYTTNLPTFKRTKRQDKIWEGLNEIREVVDEGLYNPEDGGYEGDDLGELQDEWDTLVYEYEANHATHWTKG